MKNRTSQLSITKIGMIEISWGRVIRSAAWITGFAFLTAFAANLYIPLPFTPVPITGQLLAVILAGAFAGSGRGAVSQALYLMMGESGVPVFSSSVAGFGAIVGPTGGYLIGFVVAAYVAGMLVPRAKNLGTMWLAFAAATLPVLLLGFVHLAAFYTSSVQQAFMMGVAPFIIGDIVKVSLAVGVFAGAKRLLGK
ncbi:biotin transporter BioY [bacterium]|nr:biotin transporter BioY [bacterium]